MSFEYHQPLLQDDYSFDLYSCCGDLPQAVAIACQEADFCTGSVQDLPVFTASLSTQQNLEDSYRNCELLALVVHPRPCCQFLLSLLNTLYE